MSCVSAGPPPGVIELGAMLWDHVELLARVHANLNECVAFMRTEPFCFRQ